MITLLDNYTIEQLKALALEIINVEDFKVYKKDNNKLALIDKQGADLGNIEDEEFDDLADIITRLEIYHNDYFINDINDCCSGIANKFDTWDNEEIDYDSCYCYIDIYYLKDRQGGYYITGFNVDML